MPQVRQGSFLGQKNYGNAVKGEHTLPWGVPHLEKYHGSVVFLTEALTLEALNLLDNRNPDKPFFLYMSALCCACAF